MMDTAHQHPTSRDARSRSVADGSGPDSRASNRGRRGDTSGDPGSDRDGHTAPPPVPAPGRRFTYEDLSVEQCRDLLALRHVGRIAWTAADGPQLFPISYVWHDGAVIFRTSAYGVLSELVQRTEVVFEVDDIDQERRLGWSILVRGCAAGIAPEELTRPSVMATALPWASGHRNLIIAVTPEEITGRRFVPLNDAAASVADTHTAANWVDGLELNGEFP